MWGELCVDAAAVFSDKFVLPRATKKTKRRLLIEFYLVRSKKPGLVKIATYTYIYVCLYVRRKKS